ncbi:MAG TPA: hypothetical protein VGQ83_29350 [Polyangia bacterium]
MSKTPTEISDYVRAAVDFVQRAVGMVLDGSDESLAVLDHYVAQVPYDKPEVVALVAPAVGAYFGEVLRRRFGGRWRLEGDPVKWRLELQDGAVTVAPIALAFTAIISEDAESLDTEMHVASPEERQTVGEALERTAPVSAEYFYSLTGRFETIEHTLDLIAAIRAQKQAEQERARERPN